MKTLQSGSNAITVCNAITYKCNTSLVLHIHMLYSSAINNNTNRNHSTNPNPKPNLKLNSKL